MNREPNVTLIVFGAAVSPGGDDVRTIARSAGPDWFDAWRSGSLRAIADKDLGGTAAIDAADQLHLIATGDLSRAWALARALVAGGATAVLDVHAMKFTAGSALPPAGAPLDVAREVRVVYETDSARPDHAHAIHTRGLRKFGAPDLIALCTDADVPLISAAMTELADAIARGLELGTPRHRVDVMPGVHWVVVPDEHRLGDLMQLNNEARVIVDADGHDLVGVAGRLRRAPS